MKSYLVTYDLNKPGQNYSALYNAIKKYPGWCHCLESTWIIKSDLTAENIRNDLSLHIDSNDKLLIVCLSGEIAWYNLSGEVSGWIHKNI